MNEIKLESVSNGEWVRLYEIKMESVILNLFVFKNGICYGGVSCEKGW